MPHSWVLALTFAVKFGKFDLYTRKSFASTLITSQTDESQGKHESCYQMVSNDMNLEHSISSTLYHVCTLKRHQLPFLPNFLSFQLMGSGSLCNQLWVQKTSLHLRLISWELPWLELPWLTSYSWIAQILPHLLPPLSHKCTFEEDSWLYFDVLLLHPLSTLWAAIQNSKSY